MDSHNEARGNSDKFSLTRLKDVCWVRIKRLHPGAKLVLGAISCLGGLPYIYEKYEERKAKREEDLEKEKREKLTGTNVAQGLAWSHYNGFLRYVLPDMDKQIKNSDWYKSLYFWQKKKVSTKLYELIPRKCSIEMLNSKDIKKVSEITFVHDRTGNRRVVRVFIYSITDGKQTYYCPIDCPNVLKTISHMDTIHLTKLYSSTSSIKRHKRRAELEQFNSALKSSFNWTELPLDDYDDMENIQHPSMYDCSSVNIGFTSDEKNIQLTKFYFALNSMLNMKNQPKENCEEKSKLLVFNDVEYQKLSDLLLENVKKDLLKNKDDPSPVLMIDKLHTSEEMKDICDTNYDVFVAFQQSSKKHSTEVSARYLDLIRHLENNKIRVLKENDTMGKTFDEKLAFAATRCRCIVFLEEDKKQWKFWDSDIMSSLQKIFKERKIQTIVVVDDKIQENFDLYIPDELRCVACIPYGEKNYLDDITNMITGRQSGMSGKVFINRGDIAVGLAWGYTANYINEVLPKMFEDIESQMKKKNVNSPGNCPGKLYIIIPKSCKTYSQLKAKYKDEKGDIQKYTDTKEVLGSSDRHQKFYQGTIYEIPIEITGDKPVYFVGQYAAPAAVLREMNEKGFISDEQMEEEAKKFHDAVKDIMYTAFPSKVKYCEFVLYDDTENLSDVILDRIKNNKQRGK